MRKLPVQVVFTVSLMPTISISSPTLMMPRSTRPVTGGAAVAEIGGSRTTVVNGPGIAIPAGTFTATNGGSTTRWGWTVGGGIEWAFNPNWSLAGEYRYTDFGSRSVTFTVPDGLGGVFATGTSSSRLTVEQATVRVNYRFGGPVIAKY